MTVHDPLDGDWDLDSWWSTSNTGEAVPGVLTPLNWSLWERGGEGGLRRALVAVGALERSGGPLPAAQRDRAMGVFHGRLAARVEFMGMIGDRLPGTNGAAVAEQILGTLPPGFESNPTLARLPAIAARFPRALTGSPRAVRALRIENEHWWTAEIARSGSLDLAAAGRQWTQAEQRLVDAMATHVTCVFSAIQPVYDSVQRLAASAGEPQLFGRLLAGLGNHAEVLVVRDLWAVSRGELTLATFLARHGYHGPNEGEIRSRVWREDPSPLDAVTAQFAQRSDGEHPDAVLRQRAEERGAAERALLAELPRRARPGARCLLQMAARTIPLRGVGKTSYVQAVDVARAASRRIGDLLADGGALDDPADVCFLTQEEMLAATPTDRLEDVVAARRAQREAHLSVRLPGSWHGRPEVTPVAAGAAARAGMTLQGIAASGGTHEGRVRVVLDANAGEVDEDDILVAPFTDPSWAPIMFASGALVVDIGGELSHAAVVARELGIPCVMNTRDGTSVLRDGDRCRVDGDAGTVEVLEPAP